MPKVGLVGCVKTKRDSALPAKDLYVSGLFVGRRRFVERSCDSWWVLSAKHGILSPGQMIEPYDLALERMPARSRYQWSLSVLESLDVQVELIAGDVVEVHAGSAYRDFGLVDGLVQRGLTVKIPTSGLGLGQQLQFYKEAPHKIKE